MSNQTQPQTIKVDLPSPPPSVPELLASVRQATEDLKAKDLVEIDVRGRSSVADYMIVVSGTSTRHVKSIADEVVRFAKNIDVMPLGVEGEREAEWVLVDLGDVIVHVMLPRKPGSISTSSNGSQCNSHNNPSTARIRLGLQGCRCAAFCSVRSSTGTAAGTRESAAPARG